MMASPTEFHATLADVTDEQHENMAGLVQHNDFNSEVIARFLRQNGIDAPCRRVDRRLFVISSQIQSEPRTYDSHAFACVHQSAIRSKLPSTAQRLSDDEASANSSPQTLQRDPPGPADRTAFGAHLPSPHRTRLQRLRVGNGGRRPGMHDPAPRIRQTRRQARSLGARDYARCSSLPPSLRRAQLPRTRLRPVVRGSRAITSLRLTPLPAT
jgi:hypothetical protein